MTSFSSFEMIRPQSGILAPVRAALLSSVFSHATKVGLLTLLAGTALGGTAMAQTADWLGTSSNDWFVAGNWDGNAVPGSAQAVTIDATNLDKYTVSIASAGAVAGEIRVGDDNTERASSLSLSNGGTLHSAGLGYIGYAEGVNGQAFVSDENSSWTSDGLLYVGYDGNGFLQVQDRGSLSGTSMTLGQGLGSRGELQVLGLFNSTIASLTGTLTIGNNGEGVAGVKFGGQLSAATIRLAASANGKGTLSVIGSGAAGDTTKLIATGSGGISVGRYGEGTLIVSQGAEIVAEAGTVGIGYAPGSTGRLIIGGDPTAGGPAAGGLVTASGGVQFERGNGTLIFNHTSQDDYDFSTHTGSLYAFSAKIASNAAGTATIEHLAGVTRLTGDGSGFLGTTNVTGGTLLVVHEAGLGGTFNVSGTGVLGGTGPLGASGKTVTIGSGGSLSPGMRNEVGTIGVAGDLVFESGSTYAVHVTNAAADRVNVAGTTEINGGTVSVTSLDAKTSYQGGKTYTIIASDGALTGTFAETLSNSIFLDVSTTYDEHNAYLTIGLNGAEDPGPEEPGPDEPDPEEPEEPLPEVFTQVAETPNQLAVATALDTLEQSGGALALYNKLLELTSEEAARDAFEQLSGVEYASAQAALINDSHHFRDAVGSRLGAAFGGVDTSATPMLSYAPAPDGGTDAFDDLDSGSVAEPVVVWASAYGGWGEVDADTGSLDTGSSGLLIGLDDQVGDYRLGVVVGYGVLSVDGERTALDSENYLLGVYGGSNWGALSLRTGLAYGWHDIGSARSVDFGAFTDTLSADYAADSMQAFGELAYKFDTSVAAFEPYANVSHVRLRTNGFTEKGGAAALTTEESLLEATFATLGVRASANVQLGEVTAELSGEVGYRHAFGDTDAAVTSAFAGSDSFTVTSPLAGDAVLVGAGVGLQIGPGANLALAWSGQFDAGASQNNVSAQLNVKF